MLFSLALVFLCGMALAAVLEKIGLPPLLGMLIAGILLGPSVWNVLDDSLLAISADLRKIALLIILTRAGLNLDVTQLRRVGRPAVLMCFVPACFEICAVSALAPALLGLSLVESAVLGSVLAAVSPAVVVPKMLRLMDEGYGTEQGIPQLIMAGASVDDIFVIVLFTCFTSLASQGSFSALTLARIPTSILLGLAAGALLGRALSSFFRNVHIRDSAKVVLVLSFSFLLVWVEDQFTGPVGFSGLLAVMAMGAVLRGQLPAAGARLSAKYSKLWVAAEPLLFVLVGAAVDVKYALAASAAGAMLIFAALAIRMAGVATCLVHTRLSRKERLFCALAYTPKATVQAAIGGVPLAMGLACGNTVLAVAVLAILLTAPLGAFAIERTYRRLLTPKKVHTS